MSLTSFINKQTITYLFHRLTLREFVSLVFKKCPICYLHVVDGINVIKFKIYMKVGLTGTADWIMEYNQKLLGKIEKCG